jgi:hypothetical protein
MLLPLMLLIGEFVFEKKDDYNYTNSMFPKQLTRKKLAEQKTFLITSGLSLFTSTNLF